MRRSLVVGISAAAIAIPLVLVASQAGSSVAASAPKHSYPSNPTIKIAGPQHWCGTNGYMCAEPSQTWGEFAGFKNAIKAGANFSAYIGHDEPATLFYSNQAGSGNNVTWNLVLPKEPPTAVTQTGSGGTNSFMLHPTFWFGMVMCDPNGTPNPDGQALTGHATVPCKPDSNSNIYESTNVNNSRYFGLGPGQAYEEVQFYPPGWAAQPMGIGCDATQWCAAVTIDTFSENQNTGQFNNTACLNTAGPEPVNFAFITKNGKSTAPANALHPEHFIPNLGKDFLMNPGDNLTVHLFDTPNGLETSVVDHTTGTTGSMTASTGNGFGSVVFDPSATTCTVTPLAFHPEFSTSSPLTRNVSAAHTYNVAFSDEIGHFELCGKVNTHSPIAACLQPLGPDTNDRDLGPDPAGDDDFCLPGSASTKVMIGGCTDTDGDFDGVPSTDSWPGSITNPTADQLLHPTSELFTSPTTNGQNFSSMVFEGDQSRNESNDTAFQVQQFCQRHLANPSDPNPGHGSVDPPPS